MIFFLLGALASVPYESCDSDEECTAPERCVVEHEGDNTTCRAPCANDAECDDAGGTAVCGDDDHCHLFCDARTGIACPPGFACVLDSNVCVFVEFDPAQPIPCACDDDCPAGLACADLECVPTCSAEHAACTAEGTLCTLGIDVGLCLPAVSPDRDGGTVCVADGECRSSTCEFDGRFGRSICIEECANDDECVPGSACLDGRCLARSIACPDAPPPDDDPPDDDPPPESPPPNCSSSTGRTAPPWIALALVGAALLRITPRRRPSRSAARAPS